MLHFCFYIDESGFVSFSHLKSKLHRRSNRRKRKYSDIEGEKIVPPKEKKSKKNHGKKLKTYSHKSKKSEKNVDLFDDDGW